MKFESGETVYSLKELAEIISYNRSEMGIAKTMRQIRHWTQNDLLKTITGKNTGKGIPRLYADEPTLLISAILLELCRYGATIETMRPVARQLYSDWEEDNGYFLTLADTDLPALIQIVWQADSATGEFTGADVRFMDEDTLQSDPAKRRLPELDYGVASSILLNLTPINERIYSHEYNAG